MVVVTLVWAQDPPNATNVLWSVNPSFYHHFIMIISSLITARSSLAWIQDSRDSQRMYRKSGLTLKKYLRGFWETSPVYTVCAVQCFLIFWNGFQSVESKTGTLLMYRAGGLQAGGSFLSYFVTWQHNITRQMKETAMSGIRTTDVNNSDSGPWNIWCRNLFISNHQLYKTMEF